MIRAASTALAALILLGAAPASAPVQQASQAPQWQGIALRNDGRFGITVVDDAPSEAAARAELRASCAEDRWPCDIVAVHTACIAVAYDEERLFFSTAVGTELAVVREAYAQCALAGEACDSYHKVCPTAVPRTPAPRRAPALVGPINIFAARGALATRGTPTEGSGGDARGRMWERFTAAPGQPATRITFEQCENVDCRVAIFSHERPPAGSARVLNAADLAGWNDHDARVRLRLADGADARGVIVEMTWRSGGTRTFAQAVETWAEASAEAGVWLDGITRSGW